jgi:hypothetical protein
MAGLLHSRCGDRGRQFMARIETQDQGSTALSVAGKELASGEKLVWADQPRAGALARREFPKALFGIPFTAFAVFWVFGAWHSTNQSTAHNTPFVIFPLFGLIFVGIGLITLLSPLRARMKARSTFYAITAERLLIIEGRRSHRVTSFIPADIQQIERTERPDGSGDVVFRREFPPSRRNSLSFGGNWSATRIGFFGVSDVRRVEASVRQLSQQVNRAS